MSKEIKCVVWDLDCTIWDGVLLESGTVTLKPGIYEIICELDRRGILQSVASKNNYEDAIAKLREFGIEEYFYIRRFIGTLNLVPLRKLEKI
ncbi:HAD-IIIC family phosphatase [Bacillus cereus]|nr:HAD-IIIC family phosphatase [Bacillus cereus]